MKKDQEVDQRKMEHFKTSNIVRVGDKEKIEKYEHAIINRMAPYIYNKPEHKCIIIQVRGSLIDFVDTMIKTLFWVGLREISREQKELVNEEKGYTIPDGWEIRLEKIPVLSMQSEEDYTR